MGISRIFTRGKKLWRLIDGKPKQKPETHHDQDSLWNDVMQFNGGLMELRTKKLIFEVRESKYTLEILRLNSEEWTEKDSFYLIKKL